MSEIIHAESELKSFSRAATDIFLGSYFKIYGEEFKLFRIIVGEFIHTSICSNMVGEVIPHHVIYSEQRCLYPLFLHTGAKVSEERVVELHRKLSGEEPNYQMNCDDFLVVDMPHGERKIQFYFVGSVTKKDFVIRKV